MSDATSALPIPATASSGPRGARLLPYFLSLPALLVCIGILVPFFTAAYYSLQRYKLSMPGRRGFIWFDQYLNILDDPDFWQTLWG
jgi:multiple sugar transport system permease protein